MSSSNPHGDFLRYPGAAYSVILSFAFVSEAGRARCVVICINLTPAQLKWLTEQKNPKSL